VAKSNKKLKFDIEGWAKETKGTREAEPGEIRVLKDEIKSLTKRLSKRLSGESLIIDAARQAYEDPPNLVIPKKPRISRRKTGEIEIAALHVSDTQVGKVTDTYNSTVADERLQLLVDKVCHITDIRRTAAKIEEIRVYFGGDMVEGEDIFPHQAHQIDQGVFEQSVKTAPSALARAILKLLAHFRKVKIVAVPGNHGRNGPKSTRSNPKTNWDNVCYEILKLMLLGPEGAPRRFPEDRLEIEISDSFWAVDHIFDWGNLLVHGDQITGGFAGFPWYGTAKKAWGWIDAIPTPWDYLWFGHFHTYASAVLNHRTFLANGTTESDNDYAQAQLAAAGFPCQRLTFYTEEMGLISDNQVFLTAEGERLPQKLRAMKWLDQ